MFAIERVGKALKVTRFQFDNIHFDIRYQQDMVISLYCAFIIPPLVPIDLPDTLAGPESFIGSRPCCIKMKRVEAFVAENILAECQCALTAR